MTLEQSLMEIKVVKVYSRQGILPIPVRFVRLLQWEKFQRLFIIKQDDSLIITDEKTFTTIKLNENMKIFKATLTGSNNTKKLFNHRIMLSHVLLSMLNYQDNTHVSLTLEDGNKIVVRRFT